MSTMQQSKPPSMQEVILRLHTFWSAHGCTIWQPYSEKVGAGTMNPATVLRVLGPEPWNVAYVEPSYRPDDGRFAENPNRMQMHHQYQVILKPDPGNPQELYLASLEAIGLDRTRHDIRFVEDNWESPALGAWGLGWEVWLDGQEITQFTYFQQSGSLTLDPVSVEITYGLDRIVMYLQHKTQVWDIDVDGVHTFGELYRDPEVEHCVYDFELADVERLRQMYDLYKAEADACLRRGLVIPAHDFVLRQSHTFNLLDARGAIGVTERAKFFGAMRAQAKQVSELYVQQRERLEFPWLQGDKTTGSGSDTTVADAPVSTLLVPATPLPFVLELGSEELPPQDVVDGIAQLEEKMAALLTSYKLTYDSLRVTGTTRRLVAYSNWARAHAGRRNRRKARPRIEPGLRQPGPAHQGPGGICARAGRCGGQPGSARELRLCCQAGGGQTGRRSTPEPLPRPAGRPPLGQGHALEQQRHQLFASAALAGGSLRRPGRAVCLGRRCQRTSQPRPALRRCSRPVAARQLHDL